MQEIRSSRLSRIRTANPLSPVSVVLVALILEALIYASPVHAGVPFFTDDSDTPDANHFEINLAAEYTRFRGGSVGAILVSKSTMV